MANTKNSTARKILASTPATAPADMMVTIIVAGQPAQVKLSDLLAAQVAATAAPATKPVKAAAPAIETLPVPSDAELILSAKQELCRKAGAAHAKKVAPWNGVKGAGSVGGQYSDTGREAFKAGYNAQALKMGVEPYTK